MRPSRRSEHRFNDPFQRELAIPISPTLVATAVRRRQGAHNSDASQRRAYIVYLAWFYLNRGIKWDQPALRDKEYR